MDLVTSSMVIFQFDKEPYRYFSSLLESKFGRDRINQNEITLRSLMEEVRSALFGSLVEGHVQQMHGLTRKDGGRAYCSFELYRTLPDSSLCFQVQDVGKVIDTLGRYFYFDFSLHPAEQALTAIEFGEGTSMVFAALMVPRSA
jgi:hypothetical protein